ncbi:MAG TPA: TaqI-like C-terminal specificity domain-containing protein, partial [Spirochaetota bacterium]|nr:TaqI-like C-terminal specificity domain-containing protein [Spirochaetota bacterium]
WKVEIYRGIVTGYNEAFVIDTETKEKLIKENPNCEKIIKPLIRGRDINRWNYKNSGLWIIFTKREINIENYLPVKQHLTTFKNFLEPGKGRKPGQYKWYEIQDNIAYYQEFDKDKIVWIELTNENRFAYSTNGDYVLAGAFIMTGESLKFLLAFLNSKLCKFYFELICNSSGMATT